MKKEDIDLSNTNFFSGSNSLSISCYNNADDKNQAIWALTDENYRNDKTFVGCQINDRIVNVEDDLQEFVYFDKNSSKIMLKKEDYKITENYDFRIQLTESDPDPENNNDTEISSSPNPIFQTINYFQPNFPIPFSDNYDESTFDVKPQPLWPCNGVKMRTNFMVQKCMKTINQLHPESTELFTLGKSGYGEEMLGIRFVTGLVDGETVSRHSRDQSEVMNHEESFKLGHTLPKTKTKKTRVVLFANMHGNEATGRELLIWLIGHFCKFHTDHYKNRPQTKKLKTLQNILTKLDIFIIPTINPDGFKARFGKKDSEHDLNNRDYFFSNEDAVVDDENWKKLLENWVNGRYVNFKNDTEKVDMNRDFPRFNEMIYDNATDVEDLRVKLERSQIFNQKFLDQKLLENEHDPTKNLLENRQIETQNVINFLQNQEKFDFAINFHDGAKVVNFPFDGGIQNNHVYTPSPDDELFRDISKIWSYYNPKFMTGNCGKKEEDKDFWMDGITNGAEWYSVQGGLQDYHYIRDGALHLRGGFGFFLCFLRLVIHF